MALIGGSIATSALAGCIGNERNKIILESDTNPRELIPAAPAGWTRKRVSEQIPGGEVEAGYQADYQNETQYLISIEVLRYTTNNAASRSVETLSPSLGWSVYVVRKNFAFLSTGAVEDAVAILSNCPVLEEAYIRQNNLLG